MAEAQDVTDRLANTSCRKYLETVKRFDSNNIAVQKRQPSHSTDAKLPDLTPAPTISILLSASVLISPVWRT
jgi:hypothetical protein